MSARRAAVFLTVANIAATALNYLYQVFGARWIDVIEFGQLNAWLAYIGVASSVSTFVQFASNYYVVPSSSLRRGARAIFAVSALLISAHLALARGGLAPIALGIETVGLILAFMVLNGQAQARTWFGLMGSMALVGALVRAGYPMVGVAQAHPAMAFYEAVPFSFGASVLVGSALALRTLRRTSASAVVAGEGPSHADGSFRLGRAFILSSCAVGFPLLDFLLIDWTQSSEDLGQFARAQLFSKLLLFVGLIVLQIALPYHLRAARGEGHHDAYAVIRKLERYTLIALVAAIPVVVGIAPSIAGAMLHIELSPYRTWLALSCVNFTLLYGIFVEVQRACAFDKLTPVVTVLIAAMLGLLGIAVYRPPSTSAALVAALVVYATVLMVFVVTANSHSVRIVGRAKVDAAGPVPPQ